MPRSIVCSPCRATASRRRPASLAPFASFAGTFALLSLALFIGIAVDLAPAGSSQFVLGAEPSTKLDDRLLAPLDVFQLEYASDPRIAPDGNSIVFVRNFFDIMKDRRRSNLWMIGADGKSLRPLTTGNRNDSSPRWSPDGQRLAYLSDADGTSQLYCRWVATGEVAKLTNLTSGASDLTWSPDGKSLAFVMQVPASSEPFAKLPAKPAGAEWAEPFKVIQKLNYRADGAGYLKDGFSQVFVVPADGGTPRQLTEGPFEHGGPLAWTPDSQAVVLVANRNPDWEREPVEDDLYEVRLADRALRKLTERRGPDHHPAISPDGRAIAYLGFDDQRQGYQVTRLYVLRRDRGTTKCLSTMLDRDVAAPTWSGDGRAIYAQYDDRGVTKLGVFRLDESLESATFETLAEGIAGAAIGRPYPSGSFSVAKGGRVALTRGDVTRPAEVAVLDPGARQLRTLTALNADLLDHKELGPVESFQIASSADQRPIQGWIMKPPRFDPQRKYPLLLEIHGGPFANYGERFSAEMQLYAAAGYVVVYCNPRGSTSYGGEFGNLIHHKYPSQDYDDLMSCVDAVIARGYVDPQNLFVTGGSGGGVLTAWIVGKTDRFRAAVSAKPVINWYSFALTADKYAFFSQYWFPGPPWEHPAHYLERSPLSLVGKVTTPTMLLTGEQDYRTPISESEQFYQALQLRRVDTALVRVPGASHDISARPSQLIGQVAHTLAWFEKYRRK